MTVSAERPQFYLVAGEASGDMLGAGLMRALAGLTGGRAQFAGIGGEMMEREGLRSLFPASELAVMGVFEILPHAPRLLRRIAETVDDIIDRRPAALVTIDSKAFTMRVARRLRKRRARGGPDIPLIHMVAPTVWAWRPGRARVIARFLDHLLVLFPFEPPYFERHGLSCTFTGHPVVEQPEGDGPGYRMRHGIPPEDPVLAVLPGSRPGEVRRLLPAFGATVAELARLRPRLRVVVPTVATVADQVRDGVRDWPVPVTVTLSDKLDAFAASTAALAASGTVTLELALARVPAVVAYRVSALSAPVGRLLVDRDAVVLTNRILEQPLVPLFLQGECRAERLVPAVTALLEDEAARQRQMAAACELRSRLTAGPEGAAATAARAVLAHCRGAADA